MEGVGCLAFNLLLFLLLGYIRFGGQVGKQKISSFLGEKVGDQWGICYIVQSSAVQ